MFDIMAGEDGNDFPLLREDNDSFLLYDTTNLITCVVW